jgi:hypothetical protein
MEGLAMFGKPILLAAVVSIACTAVAVAQQGSTPAKPPPTHLGHVGNDVCKSHPNLPQCK